MALTATDKLRVTAQWMRQALKSLAEAAPYTSDDVAAAVDATDAWIEANQASFNSTLPTAFRTGASTAAKTSLFCFVAMRRAGLLHAEED